MRDNITAYTIQENNAFSKDMKYEALYWALGFEEMAKGIFYKSYNCALTIKIDVDKQIVDLNNQITIVNGKNFLLDSHKSFVVLECIDKLLSMGYLPSEIIIDLDNEYDIYCNNLYIKCFEWGHTQEDKSIINTDCLKSITYSSRLISGVIERVYSVKDYQQSVYHFGIFENEQRLSNYSCYNICDFQTDDFIVKSGVATKYIGHNKRVTVPEGIIELSPCLFWDNQEIEEVVLPNSLINISGDTFYNCFNLKRANIPCNVKIMGNNPFAGCPHIEVSNDSLYFNVVEGVLYSKDFTKLIYYPINKSDKAYKILEKTKILGKHSFYLCDNLYEVTIPNSVIKFENNPFSGCSNLELKNKSSKYHVINKVIYDNEFSSVIGCLNSIETDELILESVTRICRNSFWNCKGIRKIVLPFSLITIGYNPFVGCSNIEFVSNSREYIVENGALYTKNKSKLVCYPAKNAVGKVCLPNETISLERGAFSGASKLTNIFLHNVSIINKTAFTNCDSLERVYCSDLVTYIGEWAFSHCKNLKEISIYKDCYVDNNLTLNSNAKILIRNNRSNYVIESDNLPSLLSMINSYEGKIKSILIDPPYNSHIENIGYNDAFEDYYERFMKSRLEISYKLLSKDGFLVINIDKGEVNRIASICKAIFGKNIQIHKWEKIHPFFYTNRKINSHKKKVKYEYIIICAKTTKSIFGNIKLPYLKNGVLYERDSGIPRIFSCFGTNSSAKDEIEQLFGSRDVFRTPKPLKLLKELVRATTYKDSIVLDFFAGSGTTGHAVVDLNKEDNGDRKYILISNNETNICRDVTLKRMQMIDKNVIFIE